MRFSARQTRTTQERKFIFDDAPKATRIGYIKQVLNRFVTVYQAKGSRPSEPLSPNDLHEKFCALIRDEKEPWEYSDDGPWESLTKHLMVCAWLEFYDFVEMVGKLLLEMDDNPFAEADQRWFKTYQSRLNALLDEDDIGWSLADTGELGRQLPKALADRVAIAATKLSGAREAAAAHYKKAMRYLTQQPLDEANAIKEMVSAVESVARAIVPDSSTLGDAIKSLRKNPHAPRHLLDAVDKIYTYSNATPMVRHGHTTTRKIPLAEAELAVHIGIAFIRYLIDTSESQA